MPISADHVGRRYPATAPHEVTQGEVAAFAASIGAEPTTDAPPTFAMVLAAPAWQALFDDAELGLALQRTMHAEQGFSYERPIRVGDVLTSELEITKVRQRGPAAFVSIAVDIVDQQGELVAKAPSTFVCQLEEAA